MGIQMNFLWKMSADEFGLPVNRGIVKLRANLAAMLYFKNKNHDTGRVCSSDKRNERIERSHRIDDHATVVSLPLFQ
mgnify:CR=1 FL=1